MMKIFKNTLILLENKNERISVELRRYRMLVESFHLQPQKITSNLKHPVIFGS